MNQKVLLCLSASLLSSTALANPSPCGFYGGIGAGLSLTDINFKLDARNGGDTAEKSFQKQKCHKTLSVHAGYQMPLWNRGFISTEIFVRPRDYTHKTLGINVVEETGPTTIYEDVRLRVERSFTLGVTVNWGGYINNETAAYVSLGINGANMKVSYGDDGGSGRSDKKFLFAITPGGGLVHHISDKDTVRLGYSYEIQNEWNSKNLETAPTDQLKARFKNRSHNFAISYSRFF